ncbi:MAG: patatin-like phospholipase family protein [Candidatus Bipolaricaulota bacterium]
MANKILGLALSSGGARGSAHVGVLKVLIDEGLAPDVVAGASMGAHVGAAYAAGVPLAELEAQWAHASVWRTVKALAPTLPFSGWSSGGEVTRTLEQMFGDRRIEDLERPFAALATDLESGEPCALTSGRVVDAVRASLSVPGLFTPVWNEERLLIDGGVSNPLPIDAAYGLGAQVVIAVDVLVDPAEVHLAGLPYFGVKERLLGLTAPSAAVGGARRFHPSVFAVLFQMSTVFQRRLSDLMLAAHPPEVLIRPDFGSAPPCYSRVGCGIDAGAEAARRALPAIRAALARE